MKRENQIFQDLNISDKAVAYVRVSTKEQVIKGNSIPNQKDKVLEYARENGYELEEDDIYEESASASRKYVLKNDLDDLADFNSLYSNLTKRPQLQAILERAYSNDKSQSFSHVIVNSQDRLCRNLAQQLAFEFLLQQQGIKIHYINTGDLAKTVDTKMNRLVTVIMGSIAELETNILSTRVKSAMVTRVQKGKWPGGRIPFGYYIKEEHKRSSTLEIYESEKEVIQKIFSYYAVYGYSFSKIAGLMNKEYPLNTSSDGGGTYSKRWTKSKVQEIIKNEIYTGKMVWNRYGGVRRPGKRADADIIKSKPIDSMRIIDSNMWMECFRLQQDKSKLKDMKYYSTPFILRGKLLCGICNEEMQCKNNGKSRVHVYRCPKRLTNTGVSENIVNKDYLENYVLKELSKHIKVVDCKGYWQTYLDQITQQKENWKKQITDIIHSTHELSINKEKLEDLLINQSKKIKDIEEALQQELDSIEIELQIYEELIHTKQHLLQEMPSMSKAHFQRLLDSFLKEDILTLDNERKHMLIDILIDHITVKRDAEGLKIHISYNTSKNV